LPSPAFFVPIFNLLRLWLLFRLDNFVTVTEDGMRMRKPTGGRPKRAKPKRTLTSVLRRHRGTIAALARSLDPPVTPANVHRFLAGQNDSPRVRDAAKWWAKELRHFERLPESKQWLSPEWRHIIHEMVRHYREYLAAQIKARGEDAAFQRQFGVEAKR